MSSDRSVQLFFSDYVRCDQLVHSGASDNSVTLEADITAAISGTYRLKCVFPDEKRTASLREAVWNDTSIAFGTDATLTGYPARGSMISQENYHLAEQVRDTICPAWYLRWYARNLALPATLQPERHLRLAGNGFGLPTLLDDLLSDSSGRKIDIGYGGSGGLDGKLNRVQALSDGATPLVEYGYLGGGTPVQVGYPDPDILLDLWGGTPGVYSGLDRFDRIIDLPWVQAPAGAASKLVHLQYGYNRASSPVYARDEVARAASAGLDQLYSYDGLQRLIDFQQGTLNPGNSSLSSATLEQDWLLDPVGNWDGFNQDVAGVLNQTRTHNRVNEITGIINGAGQPVWVEPAYDDNGNTTLLPHPGAPALGFTVVYDAWNFPVEIKTNGSSPKTVAKYSYNGLRHRIRKEVHDSNGALAKTILYFNNLAWQCLESRETPVVGAPTTTTNIWGLRYIDDLVCRDSGGARLYAMQDRQYKTLAIADASGVVQERYGYTPYGVTSIYAAGYTPRSTSNCAWTCLYTGREFDPETGLYYFRNRYYDASLGRFVSRDSSGYVDGFSLYRGYFVPHGVDPSGLDWHHLLPWKWGENFGELGFDINHPRWGWELAPDIHSQLESAGWGREWDDFFFDLEARGIKPTTAMVRGQLADMYNDPAFSELLSTGRRATSRYPSEFSRAGWDAIIDGISKVRGGRPLKALLGAVGITSMMYGPANAACGGCERQRDELRTRVDRFGRDRSVFNCQDVASALRGLLDCIGTDSATSALQEINAITRFCSTGLK